MPSPRERGLRDLPVCAAAALDALGAPDLRRFRRAASRRGWCRQGWRPPCRHAPARERERSPTASWEAPQGRALWHRACLLRVGCFTKLACVPVDLFRALTTSAREFVEARQNLPAEIDMCELPSNGAAPAPAPRPRVPQQRHLARSAPLRCRRPCAAPGCPWLTRRPRCAPPEHSRTGKRQLPIFTIRTAPKKAVLKAF